MSKCLNCSKNVPQTDGKRLKLYCNEACRKSYGRKQTRTPLPDESLADRLNESYPDNPKRGKEIKCFEDLHPEIQATIIRNSTDKDGKLDEDDKRKRTAIAVNYQHLFPDRYEPRSDLRFTTLMASAVLGHVRVSKPGDEDYDGICYKDDTKEWTVGVSN